MIEKFISGADALMQAENLVAATEFYLGTDRIIPAKERLKDERRYQEMLTFAEQNGQDISKLPRKLYNNKMNLERQTIMLDKDDMTETKPYSTLPEICARVEKESKEMRERLEAELGKLERQTIALDKDDNCKKILQEANVKVGDILDIFQRPMWESPSLIISLDWNKKVPINYLLTDKQRVLEEGEIEFDFFGCPITSYTGRFRKGDKEYDEKLLKLKEAGIIQ